MNGIALYLMFCLGLAGAAMASFPGAPRWVRVCGAAWALVWAGPPLAALWVAGVFG